MSISLTQRFHQQDPLSWDLIFNSVGVTCEGTLMSKVYMILRGRSSVSLNGD